MITFFRIAKKLAGKDFKTAEWCTSVGNEFGQVIMSVMTDSEKMTGEVGGLVKMGKGLVNRYV